MIGEIFPEHYDVEGRRVFNPGTRGRRLGFRPTAPMARYMAGELRIKCKDFTELCRFLASCRAVDTAAAKRDYWQPPEEFEKNRSGDCVDLGLWCWRQLLNMGYPCRFVGGKAGKFGAGHAWVMFKKDSKWFLLEPQLCLLGLRMPRISTLGYRPKVSMAWEHNKILYFEHRDRNTDPPIWRVPALLAEWVHIWGKFWIRFSYRFPPYLARRLWSKLRRTKRVTDGSQGETK